ncbi:hypothetical protein Emag_005043 [Eimeria magna]
MNRQARAPKAARSTGAPRVNSKASSYFSTSESEAASASKRRDSVAVSSSSSSSSSSTSSQDSSSVISSQGLSSAGSSLSSQFSPGASAALEALYGPHLSVLCLNAYLIPPIVSWNPYLWAPFWSCKRPQERAEQYDIVCLQEVWGTNLGGLNAMVLPTHSILPETQSGSRLGWLGELIDPVRLYTRRTGGLWFAWRMAKATFVNMQRHLFDPDSRVPFSNQNITVVELDISRTFPGKRLVLIGTHFSVLGRKPRSRNLEDLKTFCKQLVWKQYLHWLARQLSGTAGASGGPNAPPSFVADTAVLLLGDFNMDPDKCPRDYGKLCTLGGCAELRDLFAKKNNPNYAAQFTQMSQEGRIELKQPDGSVKYAGNSLFPWPFRGRVDYMFAVDSVYLKPDERYGEELSDHWPLSARICIGPPKVELKTLPCPRKEQLLRGSSLCLDSSYGGASRAAQPVSSLKAERQLASNQRAGWRQRKAPSALEPSPEVKMLRQQREERRRAAAAAAAAAAEEAELELQQQQHQAQIEEAPEEVTFQYSEEGESEPEQQEEIIEETHEAEPEPQPTQETGSSLREGMKKMLPLAAQRAQAALQARQRPKRL